jgi:hypothetical protein
MLDACRKLTPEQYAAEPVPGWTSVRATVWHIAVVIEGWLRGLANDPDESFPTEAELATVDDAERLLDCRNHSRRTLAASRGAERGVTGGMVQLARCKGDITPSSASRYAGVCVYKTRRRKANHLPPAHATDS